LAAKATGDVNVTSKPKQQQPLQSVVWRNENRRPSVHGNSDTPHPPHWPSDTWSITRFEVLENGAILHLWYAAK
jgi:hypothetical protein